MSKIEAKFKVKWNEIVNKNFVSTRKQERNILTHFFKNQADQAKFFLNGFWQDGISSEAENIYQLWNKFIIQDADKKKEGCDLDEFESHKFLESLGETLTVVKLREELRQIDLDNNNRMSFTGKRKIQRKKNRQNRRDLSSFF